MQPTARPIVRRVNGGTPSPFRPLADALAASDGEWIKLTDFVSPKDAERFGKGSLAYYWGMRLSSRLGIRGRIEVGEDAETGETFARLVAE